MATFLFFGSLAVIHNPFVALAEDVRFPLFLALQVVAALIFFQARDLERIREFRWPAIAFASLYLIALLRINRLSDEEEMAYQAALTLATFLLAWFVSSRLSTVTMRRAVMLALLPATAFIALNFALLNDYTAKHWLDIGTLSLATYQEISLVLALVGLSALGEIDRPNVRSALCIALFLLCAYFIFQGIARGEALAFAVAALLFLAPRITLLAVPFSWPLLELVTRAFDTPLTERLRMVLQGDYSMRDQLFSMAGQQLAEQPWLLFVGGGFGVFQSYYGLAADHYPHNLLIEALLVGGIPLAAAMVFLFVVPPIKLIIGTFRGKVTREGRYSLALMVFLILVGMKSGTLVSMWTLMLFAGVFIRAADVKLAASRAPAFSPAHN